jgi:hypothetical protein
MLTGVPHHVADTEAAYEIVDRLKGALAPGSHLVINHATNAVYGEASDEDVRHWNQFGEPKITLRSPDEIARFFAGRTLLEPGVVSCSRWRSTRPARRSTSSAAWPFWISPADRCLRRPGQPTHRCPTASTRVGVPSAARRPVRADPASAADGGRGGLPQRIARPRPAHQEHRPARERCRRRLG